MDIEEQFDLWRKEYANRLMNAAQAVEQMRIYAPEEANDQWYVSRVGWLTQESEEVWPDENSWPKADESNAEIYDMLTGVKVNT